MGVHDVADRVIDQAWTVWDRLRTIPVRRVGLVAAAITGTVVVVVATVLLVGQGGPTSTSDEQLTATLVTNTDLPANRWSGWSQKLIAAKPQVSVPLAGSTAKPAVCVPGGDPQQRVQHAALDGQAWAGSEFLNVSERARATTMLAMNGSTGFADAVDAWIGACSKFAVTQGDVTRNVATRPLVVNARTYRLDQARVFSQTVTPDEPNAVAESTSLFAIGRARNIIIYVTLTFPGALTVDAVAVLDTVWRAQAAKLVGRQQAGRL